MLISFAILAGITLVIAALAHRKLAAPHGVAVRSMAAQGKPLVLRIVFAMLTAGFIAEMLPREMISASLGEASGLWGILLASVLGGIIPGGPFVTFPLVLVLINGGAGLPQGIALVTAWAVFAFHRIIAFEAPLMGMRFVVLRMASSALLPILAGLGVILIQRSGFQLF